MDFEPSGTVRPTTQGHVPVEFSLQQLRCGQFNFRNACGKFGSLTGRTAAVLQACSFNRDVIGLRTYRAAEHIVR